MYDLERFYGTKDGFYKGTDSYKSYKLVQTSNFSLRLMPQSKGNGKVYRTNATARKTFFYFVLSQLKCAMQCHISTKSCILSCNNCRILMEVRIEIWSLVGASLHEYGEFITVPNPNQQLTVQASKPNNTMREGTLSLPLSAPKMPPLHVINRFCKFG